MKHFPDSMALLAGGLGTRLGTLAQNTPKSLICVNGEPFIIHQLKKVQREGIQKVVVCAGHLGEQIERTVGNGQNYGLKVVYSWDGEKLLGTGGAVVQALKHLGDFFWVMYGDVYLDVSFLPIVESFFKQKKPALMTVFKNANQWDCSNVVFHNNQIIEYDKKNHNSEMEYIDFGLGLFKKSAFLEHKEAQPFDLADFYQQLLKKKSLAGHEVFQRFYEIGTVNGLEETKQYLLLQK